MESTRLCRLFCWPPQTVMYHPSMKNLDLYPDMMKTSETWSLGSYNRKSVHSVLWNICFCLDEVFMKVTHHYMSVKELDEGKDGSDGEIKLSEEEDWSDVGVSEMSSENRELWESFLNNSDPYRPLHFSCSNQDELKASANDHCKDDDEPVPHCPQEKEDSDWSDEEDLEMSAESRQLWESFNSDPYNPLCFSCPTGVKVKSSVMQQNHTPSSLTASEDEEHNPEQSTKERAKKVHFSEKLTIHNLEDWDFASQAARDGSCWMELARDRERFKRKVEKAGEIISPCLTAHHRDRVFNKTLIPQMKAMIQSDQLAVADALFSDWLECQPEEQDESKDGSDGETEWSEEEDCSDVGVSEMSSENRELWESFLNNSDPYRPLHFSCSNQDKLKASANDHCKDDDEPVPHCPQEKEETEWSEEDSDWSDEEDLEMSAESRQLWESFNSDPYNPLCFSCPTGVKVKSSVILTASEDEEHNPEQSTRERAKKVHFSEELTIHNLEDWDFASQAARDGSCWMELARDRERFKRKVEKAGEIISPCLTAHHRDRVLDKLLNCSDCIITVH